MDYGEEYLNEETYNQFLSQIDLQEMSPPSTPTAFFDKPFINGTGDGMDPFQIWNLDNLSSSLIKVEDGISSGPFSSPIPPSPQYSFGVSETMSPIPSSMNVSPMNDVSVREPRTPATVDLTEGSEVEGIRILVQPKRYQIVNYNIYPAPELEFIKQFDTPVTIQAFLVYDNTLDIPEGFTHGDVQVLKPKEVHISFPALHLNRMTPIKNAIQQSGHSLGCSFCIKWKIGDIVLYSGGFKLVSACNQIPEDEDVRPRQKLKSKTGKEATQESVHINSGIPQPKAVKQPSGKRRASDLETTPNDNQLFFHVKVRGESSYRPGFINVQSDSTLEAARKEISKSAQYPKNFRFFYQKMDTPVEPHQEGLIKVSAASDGNCIIIEEQQRPSDMADPKILQLWNQQEVEEPVVPIQDLVKILFNTYLSSINSADQSVRSIISEGITHFLANITKNKSPPEMVSLEDFKLFLKFFGPAAQCLQKVFFVYREQFFHGFARHSDAVELLKGHPGAFLVRYSESQLKDGYFAFNVNKGNKFKDLIENYSLKYRPDLGAFIFRNRQYNTLRDFVTDSDHTTILKFPLMKTTHEHIKESKYRSETDFLSSFDNLSVK